MTKLMLLGLAAHLLCSRSTLAQTCQTTDDTSVVPPSNQLAGFVPSTSSTGASSSSSDIPPTVPLEMCCDLCNKNAACECFTHSSIGCVQFESCNMGTVGGSPGTQLGVNNRTGPAPPIPAAQCIVYENMTWGDWGVPVGLFVQPMTRTSWLQPRTHCLHTVHIHPHRPAVL